ncbi:MAG TPA: IPT/TIG domain-containing protein, partial [Stenomitos sp.]
PVLTSLTPTSGGAGTVVTLRGTNFGDTKHSVCQVSFGDTTAVTVRRISDTEIQATVPVGATSGGVVIRSNGVASQALDFQVISRLSLMPNGVGLYPGSTYTYSFQALNDRGEVMAAPFVSWALRDPSLGTISAQGTFQANSEGVTELEVRSGVVSSASWVGVSRYRATTLYGNGVDVNTGDGGSARQASFHRPYTLALDASGSLYVCDGSSSIIRRISSEGVISRFAGLGGDTKATGDEGPALDATLGDYANLAVDARNRLWISSSNNHVIRFIPLDDRDPAYRAGYIYRAAGTGSPGYSGSGLSGPQTAFNHPSRLFPSVEGMYVADYDNHRIRLIRPDFTVVDVLGTGLFPLLSGPTPEAIANISYPLGCALDAQGNMMIAGRKQLIFWCRTTGTYFGKSMQAGWVYPLLDVVTQRPFIGDGPLSSASYLTATPLSLWFDAKGACWFAEGCLVRRMTAQGRIETIAGKALEAAYRQSFGFDGEGTNALASSIGDVADLLVVGPRILVADPVYSRIRQLEPRE